jgi:hypothetical protein
MYFIHDNQRRPFTVKIEGKNVSVYEELPDRKVFKDSPKYYSDKPIFTFKGVERIFIPGKGKEKGNTILLHITGEHYVFIGEDIFEFQVKKGERVHHYNSVIGNNDVPYPSAVTDNYTYLMISDYVYVANADMVDPERPYSYYWETKNGKKFRRRVLRKRTFFRLV